MSINVDLSRDQQSAFMRYLSRHISEQPWLDGARTFSLLPTPDDDAPFSVSLGTGRYLWVHEGHTFTIERLEEGVPCGENPNYFVRLRVFGDDLPALKAFLVMALSSRTPAPPGKIWMNAASRFGHWRETGTSPAQSFDDLFLPAAETEAMLALLKHVDCFLASGERYLQAGRVHKLCLLFAGVPGAGKSSLVRALCLKYNRDLYALSLAGVSDAVCNELVSTMGPDGVLLVEDFDSLGFSLATNRKRSRDEDQVSVSRSGFLNLLDGNMAPPKGTIICLTANSCSGFDQALVRAGRVDRLIPFGEPKEAEILAALRRLTADVENREERFVAFCTKLKRAKRSAFCMASLVDFLFRHPTTYLEGFDDLLKSCADHAALSDEGTEGMGVMFG